MVLLILIVGLVPSPSVVSRNNAAEEILRQRKPLSLNHSQVPESIAKAPAEVSARPD